jgi:chorismate-pyruvate lyase
MSVNVRVVLLVEDDMTLYIMATSVPTKRWTLTLPKIDEPFGVRFHFERFFWKSMSVNVRVVLLVEDDMTLYTMVTIAPTKRVDSHITKN